MCTDEALITTDHPRGADREVWGLPPRSSTAIACTRTRVQPRRIGGARSCVALGPRLGPRLVGRLLTSCANRAGHRPAPPGRESPRRPRCAHRLRHAGYRPVPSRQAGRRPCEGDRMPRGEPPRHDDRQPAPAPAAATMRLLRPNGRTAQRTNGRTGERRNGPTGGCAWATRTGWTSAGVTTSP